MPKVDVPPTKSSLLVIRRNLTFAQEGYELLEQKRQILVLELMRRVESARTAQADADRVMAAAFQAMQEAALRSGTEALARESLGIRREHHLEAHSRSVMGTDIPAITFRHIAAKPEFSMGAGSALSDDVMRRFTEALDAIARLEALNFHDGALQLKVRAADAQSLDRINRTLRAAGWQADLVSGAAAGDAYEGNIQLRGGSS